MPVLPFGHHDVLLSGTAQTHPYGPLARVTVNFLEAVSHGSPADGDEEVLRVAVGDERGLAGLVVVGKSVGPVVDRVIVPQPGVVVGRGRLVVLRGRKVAVIVEEDLAVDYESALTQTVGAILTPVKRVKA
jgi:hypothetical protein